MPQLSRRLDRSAKRGVERPFFNDKRPVAEKRSLRAALRALVETTGRYREEQTWPSRDSDTTRLQKIAQAYWESAALMAAVELEVFTAIAHGHDTVAAVATAVGISPRTAERLLTALVAMTLLERTEDRCFIQRA